MRTSATTMLVSSTPVDRRLLTLLQVAGGAALLVAASHIKIPLFFTPVPLTLQTFAVMMIGGILGRHKGVSSVLLYLVWGCLGIPIFAGVGGSLNYLVGPTGGYLAGFVVLAYLTGWYTESAKPFSSFKAFAALLLFSLLQLAMGAAWLAPFVGWENTAAMGVLPFVPGAMLKVLATVCILKKLAPGS